MNICLYFGSFNPIHNGHLIIARHFLNTQVSFQQLWLVVSPQNPDKKANSLLNEYDRLFMIQKAIEDEADIKASNIEFGLPKPSFTIDTLTYLKEKYPNHTFSILLGSDSFSNITKWKNALVILKNFQLYIYIRPGFPVIQSEHLPAIHILDAPLLEISSTEIRHLLKEKKSIRYLVPDVVKAEIEKNNYYRNLENPSK